LKKIIVSKIPNEETASDQQTFRPVTHFESSEAKKTAAGPGDVVRFDRSARAAVLALSRRHLRKIALGENRRRVRAFRDQPFPD